MGDRRNVVLTYPGGQKIYLYTHWDGQDLPNLVAQGLANGEGRWNDPSYLARIIFDAVIGKAQGTETGYGLSPELDDTDYADEVHVRLSYGKGGSAGVGTHEKLLYDKFIEKYGGEYA